MHTDFFQFSFEPIISVGVGFRKLGDMWELNFYLPFMMFSFCW